MLHRIGIVAAGVQSVLCCSSSSFSHLGGMPITSLDVPPMPRHCGRSRRCCKVPDLQQEAESLTRVARQVKLHIHKYAMTCPCSARYALSRRHHTLSSSKDM